jgi:hypothetical protein
VHAKTKDRSSVLTTILMSQNGSILAIDTQNGTSKWFHLWTLVSGFKEKLGS